MLLFNETSVLAVLHQKHFGMLLHTKHSFSAHIEAAITTSRKAIRMLKVLSKHLSRRALDKLIKLYVRPRLYYGEISHHLYFTTYLKIMRLSLEISLSCSILGWPSTIRKLIGSR